LRENYPIIEFNDIVLPPGAVFIDYLASGNVFEDIDEDLSLWFWKFTICVGLTRSCASSIVARHAQALKTLLEDNREHVQKIIHERYPREEAHRVYDWWLETLNGMLESAATREVSQWHGIKK